MKKFIDRLAVALNRLFFGVRPNENGYYPGGSLLPGPGMIYGEAQINLAYEILERGRVERPCAGDHDWLPLPRPTA